MKLLIIFLPTVFMLQIQFVQLDKEGGKKIHFLFIF